MSNDVVPLTELLEEKRIVQLIRRGWEEPKALLELLKAAGAYGVIAYGVVFIAFYSTAGLLAEAGYHSVTGAWVDPRMLFLEDGAEGKAETLALLASFYLACKPFAPVRLGGALLFTPDIRRFVQRQPALVAAGASVRSTVEPIAEGVQSAGSAVYQIVAPRWLKADLLKAELLELAAKADAGVTPLEPEDKARFDEIMLTELPALRPMEEPTKSQLFSGEWECRWTSEKELNFAVAKGLFGLPWVRTYQTIDIPAGQLENIIEFDGGELRVGSRIAPDETDGTRFNFAFDKCSLSYKELTVSLPPIGRGWGELLYLDDEMRIQRDIRGDIVVATRV